MLSEDARQMTGLLKIQAFGDLLIQQTLSFEVPILFPPEFFDPVPGMAVEGFKKVTLQLAGGHVDVSRKLGHTVFGFAGTSFPIVDAIQMTPHSMKARA